MQLFKQKKIQTSIDLCNEKRQLLFWDNFKANMKYDRVCRLNLPNYSFVVITYRRIISLKN